MTLTALLNRPCTITTRADGTADDGYGNPTPVATTVTTVCELQQKTRDEPADEGELSVTQWLAIFPAGTILPTSATVTIDGQVYEVIGDSWAARNPRTQQPSHVEATLKRAGA